MDFAPPRVTLPPWLAEILKPLQREETVNRANNPLLGFQVDPALIQYVWHDLQRPECILAEPDGTLWSADARGGVVRISPGGTQKIITQSYENAFESAANDASRFTEGTLPNGLAFAEHAFPISGHRCRACPWCTGNSQRFSACEESQHG